MNSIPFSTGSGCAAAIGIYSVVLCPVAQRTQEIGIRPQIMGLILARSLAGAVIGGEGEM